MTNVNSCFITSFALSTSVPGPTSHSANGCTRTSAARNNKRTKKSHRRRNKILRIISMLPIPPIFCATCPTQLDAAAAFSIPVPRWMDLRPTFEISKSTTTQGGHYPLSKRTVRTRGGAVQTSLTASALRRRSECM